MYIIDITVNDNLTEAQHNELFPQHAAWFKKFFEAGNFLMLGPFNERERAGVIIAQAESRAELDAILAQDCYYPNLAKYEIHEFTPKMIAQNIERFLG